MPRAALAVVTGSVFLFLIGVVASLSAQDYRAKLQGVVRDSTQAIVVGAKATLTNVNTGILSGFQDRRMLHQ